MSAPPEATSNCCGQDSFAAALFDPQTPPPGGIARHADGRVPVKRFSVYRNNVMVSLTEYLARTFPVVCALVGEEFFAGMAGVFIRRTPPVSPVLMEYGGGFAGFIDAFAPAASVPYLGDVARLEDAQRRAYHAADADPASPQVLADAAGADPAHVYIGLHPSAGIVTSRWPVLSIWQVNTGGRTGPLPTAGEDVLVLRPGLETQQHLLPAGAAIFCTTLLDGACLMQAEAVAKAHDARFDLTETLTLLILAGAVTGVSTS